jgi:phosphatidylethanolamine-binding protein (PEBP) family uncharacterized protein
MPIPKETTPIQENSWSNTPLRLEKANIIPTILDPFTPLLTLNVTWKKTAADLGNSIKPKKAKKQPSIALFDVVPSSSFTSNDGNNSKIQLTIALTDPDAPSAEDPEWSQFCHWIATDAQLSPPADDVVDASNALASGHKKHKGDSPPSSTLTEILPYKAPGPPPKTGSHRYVFVVLAPLNATTERLNLTVPASRKRWGFEGERAGVREWAGENGLGVVGESWSDFLFCNMFFAVLTCDIRSELRVCEEQEAVMNLLCCDSDRSTGPRYR